jgi:hypothetical protein
MSTLKVIFPCFPAGDTRFSFISFTYVNRKDPVRFFNELCSGYFFNLFNLWKHYHFSLLNVEDEFRKPAGHQISVPVDSSDTQNRVGGSFPAGE